MDDDDFEVMELPAPPARRFMKIDLAIIALSLASDLANAVADNVTLLHDIVAMHANFRVNQDAFHAAVAQDIETLAANPEEE